MQSIELKEKLLKVIWDVNKLDSFLPMNKH